MPTYLEEFSAPGTEIKQGPAIAICRGVGDHTHQFLAADGFEKYKGCNEIVCTLFQGAFGKCTYCLLCYESLVPLAGEPLGKPVNQMQDELADYYNFNGVDDLTMEEVEDYYEVREVVNARACATLAPNL